MPATSQKPTHSGAGKLPDESPASGSESVPWETPQRPAYPGDEDRNPVGEPYPAQEPEAPDVSDQPPRQATQQTDPVIPQDPEAERVVSPEPLDN